MFAYSKKEKSVKKATSKKIYYREYTYGDEWVLLSTSKLKSAKITSKTQFYCGDKELFFSGKLTGGNADTQKWIKKISKAEFLNIMKTYQDVGDQVIIKNGKVQKVIINLHVAD